MEASRGRIIRELEFHLLKFCEAQRFGCEKTCAMFSIVHELHGQSVERDLRLEEAFSLLKELVVSHGVQRPPKSVQIFSFNDVDAITRYITDSYLRHFRLYKHAFTAQTKLRVEPLSVEMGAPIVFTPLELAAEEERARRRRAEEAEQRELAERQAEAKAAGGKKQQEAGKPATEQPRPVSRGLSAAKDSAKDLPAPSSPASAAAAAAAAVAEHPEPAPPQQPAAPMFDAQVMLSEDDRRLIASLNSPALQDQVTRIIQDQVRAAQLALRDEVAQQRAAVEEKIAMLERESAAKAAPAAKKK